jgi:5-methylcytosine-specific restriction protein A
MRRASQICNKVGCNTLIETPGYCDLHASHANDRFRGLPKAAGSEAFYSSAKWKKVRRAHRRANPLCVDCQAEGKIVKADLVDHTPERNEIIAMGESPYDPRFLASRCHAHHNKKLRERWAKKK